MESLITNLPVSFVNETPPCNSTRVPSAISKKRPNSVVFGNCPVKKRTRILSPNAKLAVVPTPGIPIMDSGNSIYTFLRSIHAEHSEEFAPVCTSKCSSSRPVENKRLEPDLISVPVMLSFKTVHTEILQQIEALSPVTHVATGTLRESPLYTATGREGDSHFLAYPARLTVKKALKAFLQQKNNFEKATFVVDRHPSNGHIFKGWSEVTCIQPEGTVSPMQMYVLHVPKVDQEKTFKYTTEEHSLQFQGTINTVPCLILLDTGASGTAFIDRQHCVNEGIALTPAPSGLTIVLADGSRSACTNMATVKLRLGRYKCQVECLVIDHLEGYPLVLGNPWLNQHSADISYQRKQVILRKPDGPQYIIT